MGLTRNSLTCLMQEGASVCFCEIPPTKICPVDSSKKRLLWSSLGGIQCLANTSYLQAPEQQQQKAVVFNYFLKALPAVCFQLKRQASDGGELLGERQEWEAISCRFVLWLINRPLLFQLSNAARTSLLHRVKWSSVWLGKGEEKQWEISSKTWLFLWSRQVFNDCCCCYSLAPLIAKCRCSMECNDKPAQSNFYWKCTFLKANSAAYLHCKYKYNYAIKILFSHCSLVSLLCENCVLQKPVHFFILSFIYSCIWGQFILCYLQDRKPFFQTSVTNTCLLFLS